MEKISFIPQKENKKSVYRGQGPGVIIFFSGVMFIVSLLAFGGTFLYKDFIQKQINVLDESLSKTKSAFDDSFISELDKVSSKIALGEKLIREHGYLSRLFAFLEKKTLKNVSLTSFNYSGLNSVNLSGDARSYTSVANQVEAFKDDPSVESVDVLKLSLKEGGIVGFDVKIEFSPSFFSYLSLNNK